jgi:hypothetical protein
MARPVAVVVAGESVVVEQAEREVAPIEVRPIIFIKAVEVDTLDLIIEIRNIFFCVFGDCAAFFCS